MDSFSLHPYEDNSSVPPSFVHPRTTTISLADYPKLVKLLGKAFDGTTEGGKKLAAANNGVFDVLSGAEYDRWEKATAGVVKEWIGDVAAKGGNGQTLYDEAKALIKKYGG